MWPYLVSSPLTVVHGQGERRVNAPRGRHFDPPSCWESRVSVLTFKSTDSKGILEIRQHSAYNLGIKKRDEWNHTEQRDRKPTFMSFRGIQVLLGTSSLPNTVPVCFVLNMWLLEGRTGRGPVWLEAAGHARCQLILLKESKFHLKTIRRNSSRDTMLLSGFIHILTNGLPWLYTTFPEPNSLWNPGIYRKFRTIERTLIGQNLLIFLN